MRNIPNSIIATAARGLIVGSAIAFWIAVWVVGFLKLWEQGRLTMGVPIPDESRSYLAVEASRVLAFVGRRLSVTLPTDPMVLALLLVGAGASLGVVLASLSWLLRVDPRSIGRRSLFWALRGLFGWRAILSSMLLFGFTAAAVLTDSWLLVVLAFSVILVGTLVMPLMVCREDLAASSRPSAWWRLQLPDRRAVLWFLGIEAVVLGIGLAHSALPSTLPTGVLIVVGITVVLPPLFAPLLQAQILVSGHSPSPAAVRSALAWRYIGPWLVYHFWLTLFAVVCMIPVLAVYVWLWKIVPIVSAILESRGQHLPFVWSVLISGFHFTGRFWWLFLMLPIAFLYWLGAARLVRLAANPLHREDRRQDPVHV